MTNVGSISFALHHAQGMNSIADSGHTLLLTVKVIALTKASIIVHFSIRLTDENSSRFEILLHHFPQ
jgi:hypothetical protein